MITPDNPNWLVLYTRSKWEKKVDQLLKDQNIKSYCPLVKTSKKWVDRRKTVEIPLFNSYLFVHANIRDLEQILQTTGVVTYVRFCGKPAVVRDSEMEDIRSIVNRYSDIEAVPLNDFQAGDKVLIKDGLLAAHTGQVQQVKGKSIVMIIESMNCALTVKIDSQLLSVPRTRSTN